MMHKSVDMCVLYECFLFYCLQLENFMLTKDLLTIEYKLRRFGRVLEAVSSYSRKGFVFLLFKTRFKPLFSLKNE